MDYLAIPQSTAAWLHSKALLCSELANDLPAIADDSSLTRGVATVGPLRITATSDSRLLALWNIDYLGGTGDESWGICRLTPPNGLLSEPKIIREVFERILHIFDLRLQNLLLDSAWRLRTELPGVTTCIAGRGEAWEQYRLAYVEGDSNSGHSLLRGVAIIGPAWEDASFRENAAGERATLQFAVAAANSLLVEALRRP